MKKHFKLVVQIGLVLLLAITPLIVHIITHNDNMMAAQASSNFTGWSVHDETPVNLQNTDYLHEILPMSGPGDIFRRTVYTQDNVRVRVQRETGILVDAYGRPLVTQRNNNTVNSEPVVTPDNGVTMSTTANETLAIFLDSRLDRAFLRSGGRYVSAVTGNRNVYLVDFIPNLNQRSVYRPIYIFIHRYQPSAGFFGLLQRPPVYTFYDMNGRAIYNQHIRGFTPPERVTILAGLVTFIVAGGMAVISGGKLIPTALAMVGTHLFAMRAGMHLLTFRGWHSRTTLDELFDEMAQYTEHPWDPITIADTGEFLRTFDNRIVRINPRQNQITDSFGFALFNVDTGLPIILHNGYIIDVRGNDQVITGYTLQNVVTVERLLYEGIPFHQAPYINSPFGREFTAIIVNLGTDVNPNWRWVNGDDANDYFGHIRDSSYLRRGSGTGFNWNIVFEILIWIGIAFIVFMLILAVIKRFGNG